MNEREKILARVREALRLPAPKPGHAKNGAEQPAQTFQSQLSDGPAQRFRPLLPPGGTSAEDRLSLFQTNATNLKADFHLVSDRQALAALLHRLRDAEKWEKVGSHGGDLTDFACASLGLPVCRTDAAYQVHELETCGAGLTLCDALVAQTGSVLITSRSAGGRALSVLPPHHVVLARRDQLVGDLPEAFALLESRYGENYPSFISFITGPSRTGDIERILVLGAHGPKKLTIICV